MFVIDLCSSYTKYFCDPFFFSSNTRLSKSGSIRHKNIRSERRGYGQSSLTGEPRLTGTRKGMIKCAEFSSNGRTDACGGSWESGRKNCWKRTRLICITAHLLWRGNLVYFLEFSFRCFKKDLLEKLLFFNIKYRPSTCSLNFPVQNYMDKLFRFKAFWGQHKIHNSETQF